MRKKIILASASPRRKELLSQIGITFEIIKAEKEEHITSSIPTEVVKELSMQKAKEVAAKCDGSIIIGADTIVAMEGQILGKPKDRADAMRMLRLLQGKKHQVITGVTVLLGSTKTLSFAEVTDVSLYPMTDAQIERYIATGEPMDKAGAYGVHEWIGFIGVENISGSYYNIMGLPVQKLYRELLKV